MMSRRNGSTALSKITINALLAAALLGVGPTLLPGFPSPVAYGQTEIDPTLKSNVEDFWHFAKMGRYDAANAKGQAVIDAGADPLAVLGAFEAVTQSASRKDDLDVWMVRFQSTDEIKGIADQLAKLIADGRFARRSDPEFITANIERLIVNPIGYRNGVENLRNSGELAVPVLLDYLGSPSKKEYHDVVRRAFKDLGKPVLNPLVASTEMSDANTLAAVIDLLGELGYADVSPYLLRLSNTGSETVKEAANRALTKLGVDPASAVDSAWYDLATKYYYDRASITADNRNPVAYVWYWDDSTKHLIKKDVAPILYGRIMAMRASEYSLGSASSASPQVADDALALWLTANYKRETDVPEGQTDATRGENQPDANYYGVASGSKYLSMALDRAIRDRTSPVAFHVLRSMQQSVGRTNIDVSSESSPVIQALSYPDRAVRYEAAIVLAQARPLEAYTGSDSVVPLLGEAVSQTGKPTVLMLMPDTGAINANKSALEAVGYKVSGATTAGELAVIAGDLPAVDVVVISSKMPADQVDAALTSVRGSLKLRGAAKVILVDTNASQFEELKKTDPLYTTSLASNADELAIAVEAARAASGALPLDAAIATDYAIRAATVMRELALVGGIYKLDPIKGTLLGALADERTAVVVAVSRILAEYNDADAQKRLLARAVDARVPNEQRVAIFEALAANARNFGNKLDASELEKLETAVTDEPDLDVRGAAAEARGGLGLPADLAKSIIVKQSVR